MRFKAVLITKENMERPIQIFSNYIADIRLWSLLVIERHKGSYVMIYEQKYEFFSQINDEAVGPAVKMDSSPPSAA